MLPGLTDSGIEPGRPAIQHDRRRIFTDLIVEMVKVVLGRLQAIEVIERQGTVCDLQGQHFQAGLHPLHGVAAFVGQPRGHFADGGESLGLPLGRHVAEARHVSDMAAVTHQRAGKALEDPAVLEMQDVGLLPRRRTAILDQRQKGLRILDLGRRVL